VILNGNTKLVAIYKSLGVQTVSILGKTLDGRSLVGVGINIISYSQDASGGTHVSSANDTMPANITAKYGQTYTIVTGGTRAVAFKYWSRVGGSTNSSYTLKVNGNTSITAYFDRLPIPYVHSGRGNHTITVIAHTLDGGEVVGAYFQVRINGAWNHYADGYTPASVTVPDGVEKVVMYHCAQVTGLCTDKFFVYRYYNNTMPSTLTRWQYVNVNSDMVFHSFYEVIPATDAVHLTIEAMNSTGPIYVNCTCGADILIKGANGTSVAESLEPYSFWLWKGRNYTVMVGDIPGYKFVKWTTGATSYTINFTARPDGSDNYTQYFAAIYSKKS
jgi:hypothetical protein